MTKRRGFRFGLKAVLGVILVFALVFSYLRLVDLRVATWEAASPSPYTRCSVIVLRGDWFPLVGWYDVKVTFYAPAAGFSPCAHPASGRIEKGTSDPFLQAPSTKSIGRFTLMRNDWSSSWGDPMATLDAFASDKTVPEWTEDEFLKWIAAREARAN